jgi:hypothetical protein
MPDFPTIEGSYRVSGDWEIVLHGEFQRRFEEGTLVLWRPGLTARVRTSSNDNDEPKELRLLQVQHGRPAEASDVISETNGALLRYAYRLKAASGPERTPAFHGFVIGNSGHVHLQAEFDEEAELAAIHRMWRRLREVENCPTGGCS